MVLRMQKVAQSQDLEEVTLRNEVSVLRCMQTVDKWALSRDGKKKRGERP